MRKILAYLAKSLVVCNCSLVALAQGLPQGATSRTGAVSIQVENDTPQLQVYDLPPDIVGAVMARLSLDFANNPKVRVTTEPKTGRLMVMAPSTVQAQIANKMQQLRQEAMQLGLNRFGGVRPDAYTQNSYTLQNLTWREFEDAIRTVMGPKATINTERNGELAQFRVASPSGLQDILQVDRRLNQVNMQGSIPSVAAWMQVVQALDQSHRAGSEPTHILPIAPAEPAKVERALRLVSFAAQQQQNNQQEEEEATAVIGQPNRNNQQPGNQQPGNAQDEQAAAIGSVDSLGANSGLFGNVQIEFVNELGVVIVRGNKRDVQRVLEVIDQIKQQSVETQPEIEIYMLKNADSIALGTLVRELYTQVLAPRQGTVSITSLGQPNALLLIGRREAIGGLTELLDKLDQPLDPSSQLRVFRLLNASAVDAETTVRNFFVERPGTDENPRTGLGVRVKVTADYRTNSLIVQASPRDMTEVAKLIEDIDVESTDAQNEMRVFSLKNSIAEDLEPVLQAAISGQAANQQGQQGGGGGTARATPLSSKLSIVTSEGESGEQIDSGILAGVVVTANPANNTIVVRAPSKSMPLIAALIEQLDQLPGAEASIKVFTVKNGDATSLATVVQQLFGLPVTAGTGNTGGLFGGNNQLANLGGSTGGDSSLVPLRVSVDTRTNSIIASGSASDLEVIEVLLLRLDEEGVSNRVTEVIWLRNAAADDVATALNNYLTTQRQIVQQTLLFNQSITRTEQFDREIIVVPEAATNSLVISASPKYYETVRSVIDSLDRRPPMVMVQVLIAEVSLDDGFEWGAELGLQDAFLYDRGVVTGAGASGTRDPGFDFIGSPLGNSATGANRSNIGRQGTTSFGVGQAGTFGYGGLVLSAASESVNFLLRTLHDARRLQVLSRPQIMTLDGQPARILVGQSVPRVTGANNNGLNGGFTTTTTDEDVGLIMDITPRVNQDGLIVMNVAVERSGLSSQQGIPIAVSDGQTIFSPIINRTQADTVISAYNNQTVVFAGLITKQRETIARRVPYISDIPILGLLFRSDVEVEKRSELLVVMTPHLVTDEDDLNIIKEVESSRMSWCLADVLEMHGDVGLNGGHGLWGPAASAMMYPEMEPGEISKTATDSIPVRPNIYPVPATPAPTQGQVPEVLEGVPAEGAQEGSVIQTAPIDPASYYEQGPGMAAPVGYYPVQSGPMVQPAQMIQPYPMIPANPAMQPGQGTIRR